MTTNTFLIIAGAAVIAGYLIFRFLLKLYRKPVLEIDFSPVDHPKWSASEKIKDLADAFLRNGFEEAATYSCWQIPSLIVAGFVRPSEQIAGVLYDHPISGIWVDCYVPYADGGSLTVSNAPAGQEMDHMPQQEKIYSTGSSVDELLKRLRAETKHTDRLTITKEEFASHFEDSYQKEIKWRMERGGPSSLEVMRAANAMGQSPDSERLQEATQTIDGAWTREKNKPKKKRRKPYGFDLPKEFQGPETFRLEPEQKSEPLPQLNLPVPPVYLVLLTALIYWCDYGYRYNETHYPVSLTALFASFSMIIVLSLLPIGCHDHHRRVRLCPLLKRLSDLRPGAFLVIKEPCPSLFYARENWLGKLVFNEGGEHEKASTRLNAISAHSMSLLTISRESLLHKALGSDEETLPLPESDFSRKFTVSGTDIEFAQKLLNPAISDAIPRLDEFGQPLAEIDGSAVTIQIDQDFFGHAKKVCLKNSWRKPKGSSRRWCGNPGNARTPGEPCRRVEPICDRCRIAEVVARPWNRGSRAAPHRSFRRG